MLYLKFAIRPSIYVLLIYCIFIGCKPSNQRIPASQQTTDDNHTDSATVKADSIALTKTNLSLFDSFFDTVSIDKDLKIALTEDSLYNMGVTGDTANFYRGMVLDNKPLETVLGYYYRKKQLVDGRFYAVGKILINDSLTGYLIREPSSYSATRISLYLINCNKKLNQLARKIELSDDVGDEGLRVYNHSKIKKVNPEYPFRYEIFTKMYVEDNGKIESERDTTLYIP